MINFWIIWLAILGCVIYYGATNFNEKQLYPVSYVILSIAFVLWYLFIIVKKYPLLILLPILVLFFKCFKGYKKHLKNEIEMQKKEKIEEEEKKLLEDGKLIELQRSPIAQDIQEEN